MRSFHAATVPIEDEAPEPDEAEEVDVEEAYADAPPPSQERPLAIPGPRDGPPTLARAEEPAPEPAERERDNDGDDDDDKRIAGMWGGVHGAATSIDQRGARGQTFDLGFHLGRVFVFSGTMSGINSRDGGTELAVVGVRPGIVFAPDRKLHPRADFLWGVGVDVHDTRNPFNVAEPRAGLELSLGDWGRLDATLGYRMVPSNHPRSADLSGLTAGVGVRLGWF